MTAQQPEPNSSVTVVQLLALLATLEAGRIDALDFTRAAAVAVYVGKVVASRAADIAVSTVAGNPPRGIRPSEDTHVPRLEEAVDTILEEPQEAAERLERLAVSEVLASEQKTLRRAIEEHGFPGWREDVAEDACDVCQPFRDRLHEAGEAFEPHHPRCRCTPVPFGEAAPEQPTEEPIRPGIRITRVA